MTSEQNQVPFLKYPKPVEFTVQRYFINESGLKVCAVTGGLIIGAPETLGKSKTYDGLDKLVGV
jgi:hypothetical protein